MVALKLHPFREVPGLQNSCSAMVVHLETKLSIYPWSSFGNFKILFRLRLDGFSWLSLNNWVKRPRKNFPKKFTRNFLLSERAKFETSEFGTVFATQIILDNLRRQWLTYFYRRDARRLAHFAREGILKPSFFTS